MTKLKLIWGDGFLSIEPEFPDFLRDKLRYWHRGLEYDLSTHKRAVVGRYHELFRSTPVIDANQQLITQTLVLHGLLHRVKRLLDKNNVAYTLADTRTPFPKYDLVRAMAGLRPAQLESVYTALESGGGLVQAPTGFGKTRCIAAIIKAYKHDELRMRNTPLTVVTTAEKDVNRKNYNDLVGLLPGREVGLLMSGIERMSDDIMIVTMDSLHKIKLSEVGIMIADEVHTAATEERVNNFLQANKARTWGFSATPYGRFDGADLKTEGLFGPVVYTRTYADCVADGALVPITVYWVKAPPPVIGVDKYQRYKSREAKYRWGVEANPDAVKLIAAVVQHTPDTQQLLCIMQHLAHMNAVRSHMPNIAIAHGETSADNILKNKFTNLQPVSTKGRRLVYDDFASGKLRKVLSTYIYKQGVNFPELTVLVCAGGGGSEIAAEQIPGRASRNIQGKDAAYIVEFWHGWDQSSEDGLKKMKPGPILHDDMARDKVYERLGFNRIWVDAPSDLPFYK